MKRRISGAVVGLIVATGGTAAKADLADALQGYWQFEGSGADGSGFGRDVALNGVAGYDTGLFGQALNLPWDPDAYAYRPVDDQAFDFGAGDFTIQTWVNYNSLYGEMVLVEKFTGAGGPGWTLSKLNGDAYHFYAAGMGSISSPAQTISLGEWHHVVAVREGDTLELFFDNDKIASGTGFSGAISDTSKGLLIGQRDGPSQDFRMDGRLDEIAIWTRALGETEIETLYNDGAGLIIPEPAALCLLGLGSLAVLRRGRG